MRPTAPLGKGRRLIVHLTWPVGHCLGVAGRLDDRDGQGKPKDGAEEANGGFQMTYPSNLWTDTSVPFWSMPENMDHPTQKPVKLIAKLMLVSSKPDALVLDPFLDSGTPSIVAKKLGHRFVGIEREETYCLLTERRLEVADAEPSIQGYAGGCFWDRNTLTYQGRPKANKGDDGPAQAGFFEDKSGRAMRNCACPSK
ncbi:MAG: hypothetical protein HUU55_17205 [Myxococcales bacterium]|nr:hypothetical protein [Myxococcales bacterium]